MDAEGCEACKAEQGTENTNAPAPAPWDTGNEYAPAPAPTDEDNDPVDLCQRARDNVRLLPLVTRGPTSSDPPQ